MGLTRVDPGVVFIKNWIGLVWWAGGEVFMDQVHGLGKEVVWFVCLINITIRTNHVILANHRD